MNTPFEQPQSARIAWLDTAKLIGIYLVILGHLPLIGKATGTSFSSNFISAFHMPLFFFLSGYVEKKLSVKETVMRGVKNLILPYICFYFLNYVWWFFVSFWRHPELLGRNALEGFIKPMLGMILGCAFNTPYTHNIVAVLWFLVALFWCKIMYAFGNALGRFGNFIFCIMGIAISIILWKTDRFLPFSFGSTCMTFPFYYVGSLLKNFPFQKTTSHFAIKTLLSFLSLLLTAIIAHFNGDVGVTGIEYGKSPLLFFIGAFSGITMICTISQLIPELHSFGKLLAQNTIIILAVHSEVHGYIQKCYALLILQQGRIGDTEISNITGITLALIVLLLCAIPCYVISRYFPWMLGRKNLRRARAGGDSV